MADYAPRRRVQLAPGDNRWSIDVLMSRKTMAQTGARCAARRTSPSRAAKNATAATAGTRRLPSREIVAREFALKRYIRAHSAEKYLIYHSTLKRPCGQLIVVDDGYDLFLTMMLYPSFAWDEPPITSTAIRRAHVRGDPRRRRRGRGDRAVGRRQVAPRNLPLVHLRAGGLERRDVRGAVQPVAPDGTVWYSTRD